MVVWVHQESDSVVESYANNYQTNFSNFISQARIDLSLPDLKFFVTLLRNDYDPAALFSSTVRTAVNNVVLATPNTWTIDTNTSATTLWTDLAHYRPQAISEGGTMSAQNLGGIVTDKIIEVS